MKDFRRFVTTLVIGSFSVAALLGIIALLGGGELGETEGKVLLTTVIVGVESIAVLCYLAVAGKASALIGLAGGLISLVPFGIALALTWGGYDGDAPVWDVFGVSVTIAATMAHACLLLALDRGRLRLLLGGTLVAMAIVAAMICNAILNGENLGDLYWRSFGVVAILDVLGTVVFAALGIFGRRTQPDDEPDLLTPALESRVVDAARSRGVSPSQLISDALDSFLR
ncbi:CopG family transcriptional regulator [Aeromicrobium sp.]|uniref:ribbon-helix-helix domain-containing protein n=1 Tax=Aeromicrobium sp. TaxID=1871063 RepID=UPI003C4342C2